MDYQKLFEYGKKMGFEDLEIGVGHNQSLSISLFKGKVEKNVAVNEKKFVLKGLSNDKMAQISFEDENIDEKELIKKLKENVESLTTDEKYEIFAGSKAYPDSINRNAGFKDISSLEKIELLKTLEKEILSLDERIKAVPYCSYEEDSYVVQIINSKGLNLEKTGEFCFLIAQAVAKQEEETQDAFEIKAVLKYEDFDLKAIAKKLVDEAISMLGAKPIKSGQYPVIFEKKAMSSLFGAFSSLFNGEAAIKKLTSLTGKEGQEIMNKNINIIEDPLDLNYIRYQPFDDEGVATYKKHIIKEGVFTSFIHNLKTAKYFKTKSTGNAFNGSVGFSNVYIESGTKDYDEMILEMENGLLITSLSGLHAGVNPISGDFSLQSSGFYIKDGKIEKPVTLIVVSGNFLKMMNNIEEIGSDLELRYNGMSAPSIKVKSLPVSGE